ncbi:hypothetical protein AFK24_09875 [Pseudomonas syringae]|uniref:Uncharacterized protein n=1 Tax=Pseudomonas syringae TaxID=317 RepID=A0A1C7Z4X4_PSESX|nr:hypothetical protein AFK24_09875 [Pseudomonas syringae]
MFKHRSFGLIEAICSRRCAFAQYDVQDIDASFCDGSQIVGFRYALATLIVTLSVRLNAAQCRESLLTET